MSLQRQLFSICYLLIAGALLCFAIFFGLKTATTDTETDDVAVTRTRETLKSSETSPVRSGVWDDAPDAFYATIVDNNLFRPLGFRATLAKEPYRLLATILVRGTNTSETEAIIETTLETDEGETTLRRSVSEGDTLDNDTKVVAIKDKQVTLSTKGEKRTLQLPSGF